MDKIDNLFKDARFVRVLSCIRWLEGWGALRPSTRVILMRLYDLTLAHQFPYFEGSQADIARFAGIAPTHASGCIKQLRQYGLVTVTSDKITIVVDPTKWRLNEEERALLDSYEIGMARRNRGHSTYDICNKGYDEIGNNTITESVTERSLEPTSRALHDDPLRSINDIYNDHDSSIEGAYDETRSDGPSPKHGSFVTPLGSEEEDESSPTPLDAPRPPSPKAVTDRLWERYKELRGYPPNGQYIGQQNAVRDLLNKGYTEEEMMDCLEHLCKKERWFKELENRWGLASLPKQIDFFLKVHSKPKVTEPTETLTYEQRLKLDVERWKKEREMEE